MHAEISGIDVYTGIQMYVRWDYTSFDPFAIHLQFHMGGKALANWALSRDLLLAGMCSPTWVGEGDVQVCRPDDANLVIRLSSPTGTATHTFLLDQVSRFLGQTLMETPVGDEQMDTTGLLLPAEG